MISKLRSAYTNSNNETKIEKLTDNFIKCKDQRKSVINEYTGGRRCIKILAATYKMFEADDKRKSIYK